VKRFIAVFGLLIAACVAGCAVNIPPTNYYVLGLPLNPPPKGKAVFPYSLSIGMFRAESPLLRRNVIWRKDSTFGFYSYEKWGELPARLFSYRLYRRTVASGLFSSVEFRAAAGETDLVLRGRLLHFEETTTSEGVFGTVNVEVRLVSKDGTSIWEGTTEKQVPVQGEGAKASVDAITKAAEETITSILSSIEQALRQYEGKQETRSSTDQISP
jgi:ABC-type uncharacterized transport system auxiliary subunit